MHTLPELLAPAGSLTCIYSAVSAGCNAVYFGGQDFNARQGAGNLTLEQMEEAVHLCRLHGVKTLLTVNTIIKEAEWPAFTESFDAMAKTGIDAVIVQDLGVASYIHEHYPQIALHGSTQMSIHSLEGVRFLEKLGFQRVVLARELSLDDVRYIREHTQMELEVFVHGALCYSVSGQCLLSSLIGGRSGNRGRCAQPCRLPYRLENGKPQYLMNLKDMCALDRIPDLIEIGVDSLKIEGRLKSPEYVYGVTRSYRMALDGRLDSDSLEVEKQRLRQLFNRGGFSQGYWQKDRHMIAPDSPKHQGVPIGSVRRIRNGHIYIAADQPLHPLDVLEIRTDRAPYPSYQLQARNQDSEGWWITADAPVRTGMQVFRLRDEALMQELTDSPMPKLPVHAKVLLQKGRPIHLTVTSDRCSVGVTGEPAQPAQNAALTEESVRKALEKTGGTPFSMESLQITMDPDVFLPVSALNAIRRDAFRQLEEQLTIDPRQAGTVPMPGFAARGTGEAVRHLEAVVSTEGQWQAVRAHNVPVFFRMERFPDDTLLRMAGEAEAASIAWGIALPYWMQRSDAVRIQTLQAKIPIRHALVCNPGQLLYFDETTQLHLNFTVPVANQTAAARWKQFADTITLSSELTAEEMQSLEGTDQAVMAYGKLPVMISRQCMQREGAGCLHGQEPSLRTITDRKNETWTLELLCPGCYTVLYAGRPVYMADRPRMLRGLPASAWRLFFLDESGAETAEVLSQYADAMTGIPGTRAAHTFIRGHFTNITL